MDGDELRHHRSGVPVLMAWECLGGTTRELTYLEKERKNPSIDRSGVSVLMARERHGGNTRQLAYLQKDRKNPSVMGQLAGEQHMSMKGGAQGGVCSFAIYMASWEGIEKGVKPPIATKANKHNQPSEPPPPLMSRVGAPQHPATPSSSPTYPLQPSNPCVATGVHC